MHFRLLLSISLAATAMVSAAPERVIPALSPEASRDTIQLPDGYQLELVLSEPDITEPVAISFDGNGRLYVVEMTTYMQDLDATGELLPKSRVTRHESTKGDGRYDKHTVFADGLLLPRMILPLQDEVVIGVTDTDDLTAWRDKNGDGRADSSRVFFKGGPRGGNMEHQPSGLLWAMDNRIYTTVTARRLRWTPEGPVSEPTEPNGGQWGLSQDDWGKPWFSNGGGERGVMNFQTHIAHGAVNVPSQWNDEWPTVWPAIGLWDVQGGPSRHRDDGTLNHFTATCGHEIFRGDRLPQDVRGNVFLPEPVGRLIRRGIVENKDGITTVRNPHPGSEFLRSTDPHFRPINMATGPDGCLYIVDMYRGVIQEGNWTKPGSFLRGQIERWDLQKNVGRGRIWRLTHRDFKPGPQPRMLEEKSAALVSHLGHPNGWWRDNAQRLLVVRQDRSVVPALKTMLTQDTNPLARAHALWTLEGLGALDIEHVRLALKDSEPRIRENAIRAAESLIPAHPALSEDILAAAEDADPNVVIQAIGTAKRMKFAQWQKWADGVLSSAKSDGVRQIGKAIVAPGESINLSRFSEADIRLLRKGEVIYKEMCFACHGSDGKGTPQQGGAPGATLAPALAGAPFVNGHRNAAAMVLLHGISGPLHGKTYEALMVPMANNNDEWIASIVAYVRNSFGNTGPILSTSDVTRLRKSYSQRTSPWTEPELIAALPAPLGNSKEWKLSASANVDGCNAAADGDAKTRWQTANMQTSGQWFQIELPSETIVAGVVLDAGRTSDYPRGYRVTLSKDGKTWSKPVAEDRAKSGLSDIAFAPTQSKFVRVTLTRNEPTKPWAINEVRILTAPSL